MVIQEIHFACGGTLFYRVHHEIGKNDHRMPQNDDAALDDIFKPKHEISFTEHNFFRTLLKKDRFTVNSLHGQGIDKLGGGLTVEAYSEDGLIEAISVTDYKAFGVGIQWHAEFHPEKEENKLNKILFKKFGESCMAFHLARR